MTQRAGFTLIELLVALGVFSLAALALLNLSTAGIGAAARTEERALAGIVAQNLAVEAAVQPFNAIGGDGAGEIELAGRTWTWTRRVEATADPDLARVLIVVRAEGSDWLAAERILFRER